MTAALVPVHLPPSITNRTSSVTSMSVRRLPAIAITSARRSGPHRRSVVRVDQVCGHRRHRAERGRRGHPPARRRNQLACFSAVGDSRASVSHHCADAAFERSRDRHRDAGKDFHRPRPEFGGGLGDVHASLARSRIARATSRSRRSTLLRAKEPSRPGAAGTCVESHASSRTRCPRLRRRVPTQPSRQPSRRVRGSSAEAPTECRRRGCCPGVTAAAMPPT